MRHVARRISIAGRFRALSADSRLAATRRWLDDIVIGERLCPFAKPVSQPPRLRMQASTCESPEAIIRELKEAAAILRHGIETPDDSSAPHTHLHVLDSAIGGEALTWRGLVSLSWQLQEEAVLAPGHGEHLQIVLFHPHATHSTYADDTAAGAPADAGDFTIRAPHPTVQLLREMDVLRGVSEYRGDAVDIPSRNRARMRAAGVETCAARLLRTAEPCVQGPGS